MTRDRTGGRRGATLAVTLMAAACAVVFALALADSSVSHLRLATSLENRAHARYLAESAVFKAACLARNDATFGKSGENAVATPATGPTGAEGMVTFAPGQSANGRLLPYSTNNLDRDDAVSGSGGALVPGQSLRLVGTGFWENETATVEALVRVPRFPFVIASSGPVQSTGGLVVGAVKSLSDLSAAIDPASLLPGNLGSNSSSARAVQLGPGTTVSGDVVSEGGVVLDPRAVVKGKVRANSGPVPIPTVSTVDVSGRAGVEHLAGVEDHPVLSGFASSSGSLTANGGLTLDGAILSVNGDLTVNGAVTGTGALFVNGATTITAGGSALRTDQVVAVVSRGDVAISGAGRSVSSFVGVVYTEGDFHADNIALVGSFVANSKRSSDGTVIGSTMTLNNVDLVDAPLLTHFDVHGSTAGPPQVTPNPSAIVFPVMNSAGKPSGASVTFLPAMGSSNDLATAQWVEVSSDIGYWHVTAGPFGSSDVESRVRSIVTSSGYSSVSRADITTWTTNFLRTNLAYHITGFTPPPGISSSGTPTDNGLSVDLNQFLTQSSGVQLLYWHEQ